MAKIFYNPCKELVRSFKIGKCYYYCIFTPDLELDHFYIGSSKSENLSIDQLLKADLPIFKFTNQDGFLKIVDIFDTAIGNDLNTSITSIVVGKDKKYALTAFSRYLSDEILGLWGGSQFLENCHELLPESHWDTIPKAFNPSEGKSLYFKFRNIPKEDKAKFLAKQFENIAVTVEAKIVEVVKK